MSSQFPLQRDVRMRGFTDRVVVQDAVNWIDRHAKCLESEIVGLEYAYGRVLGSAVTAAIDVPPFDRAAMDGYALRGEETVGADSYNPLRFRILGESMPGQPFDGQVDVATAVRIMTGASVPSGADSIVPAEYANEGDGFVEVTLAIARGRHVGRRGEDIIQNSEILAAGRRLRPQDIGLLASIGIDRIEVARHPRVRVIVTGNELVSPGRPRGAHQIFESNSSMLRGLIDRDDGMVTETVDVEDDREAIRHAMADPAADVVLVSGGSSVGAEDHAPLVLAELGELAIHGIAMRPSSPTGMGRIGRTMVILLPGNPVSCLCAYDFFAGRAIRLLGGRRADWPYVARQARVARKIVSAIGRVDYCRVSLMGDEITPLALSGASILSSTTHADGFVIIPAECEGYGPGVVINVYQYDPVS